MIDDIDLLCSGLFSDSLDDLGFKNQVITNFNNNKEDQFRFIGRARTLEIKTAETKDEKIKKGLSFIDTLSEDDVLLVKGSNYFAYFGEMMSKLCMRKNIEGVIIDGLTRDTFFTHSENCHLPILAKGYSPVDIKGRGFVDSVDQKIEIGKNSVKAEKGDLVFADNDAVIIVPQNVEEQLFPLVRERIEEENRISKLISNGISVKKMLETVKEF